jgi:large conductance mechanosensitive channel
VLKGFKEFIMRGNVVDLAVAVIIGTAFVAIVTAFTEGIIEPLINAMGGSDAAEGLGFHILAGNPSTFVNLGSVINAAINFVIIAAVVYFLIVLPLKKMQERRGLVEEAAPTEAELLTDIRDLLRTQTGAGR